MMMIKELLNNSFSILKKALVNATNDINKGENVNKKNIIEPEIKKDVIKSVEVQMLQSFDLQVISTRIHELEKAIYHLSGRNKELIDSHQQLEEIVVRMATTLEEMLNSLEDLPEYIGVIQDPDSIPSDELDEEDEEIINEAWEAKKGTNPLN